MKCVVPLAGPDFQNASGEFRPQFDDGGVAVLKRVLSSRPWRAALASSDHLFVVREVPGIERLEAWLREGWPGCRTVRLSHLTEGALYSTLAGVAALAADDGPLVVDLADIRFEGGPRDLVALFEDGVGAVVPCFRSSEPCYSYLRLEAGEVVEAAEKRVISDLASAGVYIFRDAPTYLRAAAHSIRHRAALAYRGVLFVCPMVNGILNEGRRVLAPEIDEVVSVSKLFH